MRKAISVLSVPGVSPSFGLHLPHPGLLVKRLHPKAKLPTVGHPGEDLGYDIFALEGLYLHVGRVTRVPTGVAVELPGYGFLMRERSSLAMRGITLSGGVIDAGYRGELFVNLTVHGILERIEAGDKIAQLIPLRAETHFNIREVGVLSESLRGDRGFGSTGA